MLIQGKITHQLPVDSLSSLAVYLCVKSQPQIKIPWWRNCMCTTICFCVHVSILYKNQYGCKEKLQTEIPYSIKAQTGIHTQSMALITQNLCSGLTGSEALHTDRGYLCEKWDILLFQLVFLHCIWTVYISAQLQFATSMREWKENR